MTATSSNMAHEPEAEEVIDMAHLTNLMIRQEMDRVHEFNLMLVGTTGIGKSTLVKSLFVDKIKPEETMGENKLNEYSELIEEHGVRLRVRCIETSNFDSHKSDIYTNYIDNQLGTYFVARLRGQPHEIEDTRVHCCLYMIQPYGKMRLRDQDIQCMRALHERVNLVPVIAKADTFNITQLAKFKENIMEDLKMNGINYYKFSFSEREDEERSKIVKLEAERFPFAVVAADEPTFVDKKFRWIRETISGRIDIRDKSYDFDALSRLLIRHCMLNLIDSTHAEHYAKFKALLLKQAKLQDNENLKALGLKAHEIMRIEFYTDPKTKGMSFKEYSKQRHAEWEKDLQELRNKALRIRQKPEAPREKPEHLKNLRHH